MLQASKSFSPGASPGSQAQANGKESGSPAPPARALWLQIGVAYALIEAAVWTPLGRLNTVSIALATLWIFWAVLAGSFSAPQMGIAAPSARTSARILLGGVILAAALPLLAAVWHNNSGPTYVLPLRQAMLYVIWALAQQFILQSFFYVRMESLLSSRWAVVATAVLFGSVHIPSPVLAVASFVGGLFFCEMFRRYRNIFPLGLAHALMGLTMAASFSDAVLHHMRVGIGYVKFHP